MVPCAVANFTKGAELYAVKNDGGGEVGSSLNSQKNRILSHQPIPTPPPPPPTPRSEKYAQEYAEVSLERGRRDGRIINQKITPPPSRENINEAPMGTWL